jgi:hypothetical protein
MVGNSGDKFVDSYSEDAFMDAVAHQPVVIHFNAGGPEFKDYKAAFMTAHAVLIQPMILHLLGTEKFP